MMSWEDCPEAAGPQTEGVLYGATYGSPGMPTIGAPPRQLSPEMMQRERDLAERQWLVRQRIQAAASAIAIGALEAGKMTDEIIAEINEAADRAVRLA
jgi:hypothetical protein